MLPSRRPIHLPNLLLFNPVWPRYKSGSTPRAWLKTVTSPTPSSWAQLREHNPLAAYSPLTSLVQPLHWLGISNYSAWRLTLIWPCLSTINLCHMFYHIRALRHIRGVLDQSTAAAIISALISSRLDYTNSVLFGSPAKYITRLQRVENSAAKIVAQKSSYLSSVDGRHTSRTPLVANSVAHQI